MGRRRTTHRRGRREQAAAPRSRRGAFALPWRAAFLLPALLLWAAPPAWAQVRPIGPPPLAPLPTPQPERPPDAEGFPRPPGEAERPGQPVAPPAVRLTDPTPPAFEFIQRDPERFDPTLIINPLEVPRHFFLRAVLTEEYDDNIRLAPGGRKETDVSTSLSLAGQYRFQTARTFINTANSITARYSPDHEDRNRLGFANINIVAGHQFTPRLSVGVSESLTRSDDLLQADPSASRSGRSLSTSNSFSPQASYQLTERTSLSARYTNSLVIQEGTDTGTGNSATNTFNASLSHRLTDRTGGSVSYTKTFTRSGSEKTTLDALTAGLSHAVSPRTSLTLNTSANFRNPEEGTARSTYGLSVGASRAFSETINGGASVGLQRVESGGKNSVNPSFNFSLTARGLRYQVSATASLATTDSTGLGQVTDVGQTRSQSLRLNYTYTPSLYLFFTAQAGYSRTDFSQAERAGRIGIQQGTIDKSYTVGAAANYRLARSISLRLSYDLVVRDSTQQGRDTSDNRVALSLSAQISQ